MVGAVGAVEVVMAVAKANEAAGRVGEGSALEASMVL